MDATILNIYIQVQQAVIEMEAMKAENEARLHYGKGPAYTEDSFFPLIARLDRLREILMERA